MPPIAIALLAAGGVAAYFYSKRQSPEARAAAMARLAELIHQFSVTPGAPLAADMAEAVKLAQGFGLAKTALGLPSKALPNDERWPGSPLSVAMYMAEYTRQRKPQLPGPKQYNDPAPVAPYQDPRPIRQAAIAAEKRNPVEAKLLHGKADMLSAAIRSKVRGGEILAAAKGLTGLKTKARK
jgi:hypothetical protein